MLIRVGAVPPAFSPAAPVARWTGRGKAFRARLGRSGLTGQRSRSRSGAPESIRWRAEDRAWQATVIAVPVLCIPVIGIFWCTASQRPADTWKVSCQMATDERSSSAIVGRIAGAEPRSSTTFI